MAKGRATATGKVRGVKGVVEFRRAKGKRGAAKAKVTKKKAGKLKRRPRG